MASHVSAVDGWTAAQLILVKGGFQEHRLANVAVFLSLLVPDMALQSLPHGEVGEERTWRKSVQGGRWLI